MLCLTGIQSLNAQDIKPCGHYEFTEDYHRVDPAAQERQERAMADIFARARKNGESLMKEDDMYVIPVVFHVVHDFGSENISNAQLHDAIAVLNEEFNARNEAVEGVVEAFKDIVAECHIEFRLATIDPEGNCTNGIIRHRDERTAIAGENVKQGRQWPTHKYLNVYIVRTIASGAAGYAYYPGAGPERDGIIILHSYVGRIGTGNQTRSSALTHEVGHYLGLPHTWGNSNDVELDSNCDIDDGIEDTPRTKGNRACRKSGQTCGSLDNVQNFMDYSYCYANFTKGQKAVMRSSMQSPVSGRENLTAEQNLIETGTLYPEGSTPNFLCKVQFEKDYLEPVCPGRTIQFQDFSFHKIVSREWTFEGGIPATSSEQAPSVVYNEPGIYKVSLTVSDGFNEQTLTKDDYIVVLADDALEIPFTDDFASASLENGNGVYTVFNENNDRTWEIIDGVGFDDDRALFIENRLIGASERTDALVSNTLDATGLGELEMTFQYAFAPKDPDNFTDNLTVQVSDDCGRTWRTRGVIKGSKLQTADATEDDFLPAGSDEWKERSISFPADFNVSGLMFRFVWESGGGNNFYLDNINLHSTTVGLEELEADEGFALYPNPASQQVHIVLPRAYSNAMGLKLLDTEGRVVRRTFVPANQQSVTLAVQNLDAGVYVVKMEAADRIWSKRIVIK